MSRVTTEVAFALLDAFLALHDTLQRHWKRNTQYNILATAILHHVTPKSLPAKFSAVQRSFPFQFLYHCKLVVVGCTEYLLNSYYFVFHVVSLTSFVCSHVFLAVWFGCKGWPQVWGEEGGRTEQGRRTGGQGEYLGRRYVRV